MSDSGRKIILCDLDGILNNLYPYWLGKYGIDNNFQFDLDKLEGWELADFVPTGEAIYRYLEEPGFFKYAPIMPGAKDGIARLQEKYRVVVYTACDNLPHAFADKAAWLDYYFPDVPKIIGKNYKHLFDAACLIDDSPNNQRAFKAMHPDKQVVSIAWPYNRKNGRTNEEAWVNTKAGRVPIVDCLASDYRNSELAWDCMVEHILLTV